MQKLVFRNANGIELDLTTDPFGITEWEGFSADELNIQSQQVPFQDGGVFLDALLNERTLSVTVAMNDGNDLEKRYRLRREMISKLNPKLGEGVLIYTNDFLSKQIHCIPQMPVFQNKNSNDSGTPKVSCVFTACNPYWEDLEETTVSFEIGEQPTIVNNGDVPSQIKMEWSTGGVNNGTVKNITTNKKIQYKGELSTGLEIDTNNGNKTVISVEESFIQNTSSTDIYDIAYSEDFEMYIAVGGQGLIMLSKDLKEWTTVVGGTSQSLRSVIYCSTLKMFFIGGDNGVLLRSVDGENWVQVIQSLTNSITSVLYCAELQKIVAVGSSGYVVISQDGINWEQSTTGISQFLYSVCYSEELNLFVAVGTGGKIITSQDGITWTERTSGVSVKLNDVIYAQHQFVIVEEASKILVSSNGITWTEREIGLNKIGTGITYSNIFEIYVISTSNGIIKSADGENWEFVELIENNRFWNVSFIKGINIFFVVGVKGLIYQSENVQIWEKVEGVEFDSFTLTNIKYIKEKQKYYITAYNSYLYTTVDKVNFERTRLSGIYILRNIIYVEELNLFVVIGDSGFISTSSDGTTWTTRTSGVSTSLYDVNYINELELLVVCGQNGVILTSTDGITWTNKTVSSASALYSIIYKNNQILAIGFGRYCYTSEDGETWESYDFGTTLMFDKVIYVDELQLYIGVGRNGLIKTSNDGFVWINRDSGVSINLNVIAYNNAMHMLIALGDTGTYISSSNGKDWYKHKEFSYNSFNGLFYNAEGKEFVATSPNSLNTSVLKKGGNEIQNITSNSDMNLNLALGSNQLRIENDSGYMSVKVIYRQKYVGV